MRACRYAWILQVVRGRSASLRRTLTYLPLLLAIAALACGETGTRSTGEARAWVAGERRDSAGATIITYSIDQLNALPSIDADTTTLATIGSVDGPPGTVLNQVRSIVGTPDGRMLVADEGGTVLRLYDSSGRYVKSQGAQGEGPGSYRRIRGLAWLPSDTVVVFDYGNSRMSVLDSELRFVRSIPLPPDVRPASGVFGSWSTTEIHSLNPGVAVLLGAGPASMPTQSASAAQPYVRQDTFAVVMLRESEGSFAFDTAAMIPGGRWIVRGSRQTGFSYTGSSFLAGNGTGFIVAHGSAFEIRRFDSEGGLRTILRIMADRRPVTQSDRETIISAFRERQRQPRPPRAPEPLPPEFEDSHPILRSVELDTNGNVWVRPDEHIERGRGWLVFGPDGQLRGWSSTLVPKGSPRFLGSDYALVVFADTMRVQYISKHKLNPPE